MTHLKDVIWFLAICFGSTYALYAIVYLLGGLSSGAAPLVLLIAMFIPLISAGVIIRRSLCARLEDFGLKRASPRFYLCALLYPLSIIGLGIIFVALFQTANIRLDLGEFYLIRLILLPIAPFINWIPAFGEEYGWRGFLLKRLASLYGLTVGLVATGIIWGLWHAPLILMGFNYPSYPNFVGVSIFTIWTVLAGIFLGWLRVKSGSVYPAALAHGAMNAYLGLGLIIAPSHNELLTIPMGLPAIVALMLIATPAYIDLKRSSAPNRAFT